MGAEVRWYLSALVADEAAARDAWPEEQTQTIPLETMAQLIAARELSVGCEVRS